jgi:mono/diheme cytochrome c family protein
MKLAKLAIIVAAVALFATACGDSTSTNQTTNAGSAQATPAASPKATATAATPAPDELAEAKTAYAQFCTACHQDKGEGGVVKIEGKRIKVPSLLEGHGLEHSDAEFTKQIAQGGDGMPAFKDRLNEKQINDLVRYIRRDIQAGLKLKTAGH